MLLTLIIAGVTILSITYRGPTSATLSVRTSEEGAATLSTYVDEAGKPTVASDKGYASVRQTKNPAGEIILEEYLDEYGSPISLTDGYAAIAYQYTDGLKTTITYLDSTLTPTVIRNGYDTIHRTYNDRRLAEEDTYWAGGEQVARRQGYASYRRIYNEKKQAAILEYRDLQGALVKTSSGYARRVRTFNEAGKITEERYYLPDGRPAVLSLGQSGYRRSYDEKGRKTETIYLDAEGQPFNTNKGYATVRITYPDDKTTKTQYYDADGNPVTAGRSQYGFLTAAGKKIYLDEDGEIMPRLDNILFTHPYLVLILGTGLIIATVCLKGKTRWVFLAAYLLFVIYMTMVYREAHDSKGRFELFYSYRRMMGNARIRQQIINNIWLFIPLGAIITRMLPIQSGVWKVIAAAGICIGISAAIEAVQYAAGIGLCETDDVISNGLGGLIGAAIAGTFRIRIRQPRKPEQEEPARPADS